MTSQLEHLSIKVSGIEELKQVIELAAQEAIKPVTTISPSLASNGYDEGVKDGQILFARKLIEILKHGKKGVV